MSHALVLSLLVVFFLLPSFPSSSSSENLVPEARIPSLSPAAPPSHRLRRVLLGALLGSLTGASLSLLLLILGRLCILYASASPLLRGPVVFSPAVPAKALQFALSDPSRLAPILQSKLYSRAELDGGLAVAVKRIERGGALRSAAERRWVQRGLAGLAAAKHRNVMALRGFVVGAEGRVDVVYDLVGGMSLEEAMERERREGRREMGWESRHRIAVGVAKGLRHLHFECCPRILHYAVKPSNVLLDEELEPRLADCGLAGLLPPSGDLPSDATVQYTDKSDVFSFGMILAALITGKNPREPFSGGWGKWLRRLQQSGELREALPQDSDGEEDELLMALRIAIVCLSDSPTDRPSSDELVAMLSQIHSF
ncbi:protein kinase superfamily protein [Wolffia australiana]